MPISANPPLLRDVYAWHDKLSTQDVQTAPEAEVQTVFAEAQASLPEAVENIFVNGTITNAQELKAHAEAERLGPPAEQADKPKIHIELGGREFIVTDFSDTVGQIFINEEKPKDDPLGNAGGVTLSREFHSAYRDLKPLLDRKVDSAIAALAS